MVRGWYTGASGMRAQEHRLDALSNNLANADTTGYKRDVSVHKAFPELLIRRFSDDGVKRVPLRMDPIGQIDTAPVVGRVGTGVEQNESYTIFEQGSVKQTENPFDLALDGEGFFVVNTPYGERLTRNGSFMLGPEGMLVTQEGYPVLGEEGVIRIRENNFKIDEDGRVMENRALPDDRLISMTENRWEDAQEVDRLRVVNVRRPRHLEKQGSSLLRDTWESGEPQILEDDIRPTVLQGFLETSNVNPVSEMVEMIQVNRAYEANQRVIQTHDELTGRLINDTMRL